MIWKHIRAILALPTMVTVLVPWLILRSPGSVRIGFELPQLFNLLVAFIGLVCIGLGLTIFLNTLSLFVRFGEGTLAPWDATQKLVVHGIYRHVRNPMITGVAVVLMGETLFFGAAPLLLWLLIFLAINGIFIPLAEEPGLARRFGADYMLYKRNVPAWIPRLRPWNLPDDKTDEVHEGIHARYISDN
jgi:protein-S-isoprenylcysteine O-methyltransferase Ste14